MDNCQVPLLLPSFTLSLFLCPLLLSNQKHWDKHRALIPACLRTAGHKWTGRGEVKVASCIFVLAQLVWLGP